MGVGPNLEVAKHTPEAITAFKLGSKLKQLSIDLVNRSNCTALSQGVSILEVATQVQIVREVLVGLEPGLIQAFRERLSKSRIGNEPLVSLGEHVRQYPCAAQGGRADSK